MLALLCGSASVNAGDAADDLDLAQMGVQRWESRDGLLSNWVGDVLEDADGTIWVATTGGVMRFDGSAFLAIESTGETPLPQRAVNALAGSSDAGLWVGFEHGGVYRVGEPAEPLPALPADAVVHDLAVAPDDSLFIASSHGVWRYRSGVTQRVVPPGVPDGLVEVRRITVERDGTVWARSTVHGLWRIDGARATLVEDAPGCRGFDIKVGPTGERFMSCSSGVWRWPAAGDGWELLSDDDAVGPIHLDRRGDLWFGALDGLSRWSRGRIERLPPEVGLGDWRVRGLTEDRRGDLWIGTFSGGLTRLHRGPIQSFGRPEGLAIDSTTTVIAAPEGRLWIGAWRAGLLRFDPLTRKIERWTTAQGVPGETVWTLAADLREPGALWIGADSGLARFAGGRIEAVDAGPAVSNQPVRVLHSDPIDPDTLWVAGEWPGVAAMRNGQSRIDESAAGLPIGRIRFFLRDRRGRLLCGGDAGLFALAGERWVPVMPGGRRLAALTAIAEHEDGSLWLAGSREGILRVDGDRVDIWGLAEGLPFLRVHSLLFDPAGGLWVSGNEGLARLLVADHARWREGQLARIPTERLGRRDGLRDVETNGWGYPPVQAIDAERLVYPTVSGIAILTSQRSPSIGLSPQEISINAAWSGIKPLRVDGPIRLTPQERALRVAFSAVELLRPEAVAFRYRLDGVDSEWIEARESREAVWSPLPPGRHRFRLQARMPGQAWIDAERSLPIEVAPHPWESTWLRLLALVACLLLGAAIVAWRIRLGARQANALARSRAFLRDVIDTSPHPIFVRRRDGSYDLANQAAMDVLGIGAPATGDGPLQPSSAARTGMAPVDALDAAVMADGVERILPEQEIVDANGRRRWFRIVKRPGFASSGRTVEQVYGTAVDITEFKLARQRLEREQQRLRRSREEARTLSRRLLSAQEDERRRLAQDIHDDLTQQLAGLSLLAWSTVRGLGSEIVSERREALETIARELERLARDMQSLSHDLHPPALDAFGLIEALRIECSTFARRTGLAITFQGDGITHEPPVEVGLALYRITQEALRNCLAHAGATRVVVSIEDERGMLRLRVQDDGVGFDPASRAQRAGLGISGMRERARLAGASFSVESAPERGTAVIVTWRDRRGPQSAPELDIGVSTETD